MSLRHAGIWHYERVPGRSNGREWRVGDSDDDVITDFPTEAEAADYVASHNRSVRADTDRELYLHYIGACALLAHLSSRRMSNEDKASIKAALDDCAHLCGMQVVEVAGGGWALEPS